MYSIYALLLVSLAVATASPLQWVHGDEPPVAADFSALMDRAKPMITKFILENQLDPLGLPDFARSFWVMPPSWPVRMKGTLALHAGKLHHLAQFDRADDATLVYKDKVLTIDATMKFDYIAALYNYYIKLFVWKYRGDLTAEAHATYVNFVIDFDMNTYTISLKKLRMQKIDRMNVSIRGNAAAEWLAKPINNVVIPLFRDQLTKWVEDMATSQVQAYLDEINADFPTRAKLAHFLLGVNYEQ